MCKLECSLPRPEATCRHCGSYYFNDEQDTGITLKAQLLFILAQSVIFLILRWKQSLESSFQENTQPTCLRISINGPHPEAFPYDRARHFFRKLQQNKMFTDMRQVCNSHLCQQSSLTVFLHVQIHELKRRFRKDSLPVKPHLCQTFQHYLHLNSYHTECIFMSSSVVQPLVELQCLNDFYT